MAEPLPLTPRVQNIMSGAQEIARRRGHDYVGTEHVIVAMIEDGDGIAASVMKHLGCAKAIRDTFNRLLDTMPPSEPRP